jgi:hypothetical protein
VRFLIHAKKCTLRRAQLEKKNTMNKLFISNLIFILHTLIRFVSVCALMKAQEQSFLMYLAFICVPLGGGLDVS